MLFGSYVLCYVLCVSITLSGGYLHTAWCDIRKYNYNEIEMLGLYYSEYVILQISDSRNPDCFCYEIILTSKASSLEGPRCPIL